MLLGLILEVALVLLFLQAAVVYLRAFFRDGVLGHKSIVGLIMGFSDGCALFTHYFPVLDEF